MGFGPVRRFRVVPAPLTVMDDRRRPHCHGWGAAFGFLVCGVDCRTPNARRRCHGHGVAMVTGRGEVRPVRARNRGTLEISSVTSGYRAFGASRCCRRRRGLRGDGERADRVASMVPRARRGVEPGALPASSGAPGRRRLARVARGATGRDGAASTYPPTNRTRQHAAPGGVFGFPCVRRTPRRARFGGTSRGARSRDD